MYNLEKITNKQLYKIFLRNLSIIYLFFTYIKHLINCSYVNKIESTELKILF